MFECVTECAGVHPAMVCICGGAGVQAGAQELLHPQGDCSSYPRTRCPEADTVPPRLEKCICRLHIRYVPIQMHAMCERVCVCESGANHWAGI